MLQKPLSQQLEDRQKHSMELDPDVVARSFGAVMPVNEPFPETPFPITHVEADVESSILLDERAPRPTPAVSILELAMRRLQSLRPRTDARKAEISNAMAVFAVPLEALDLLVAQTEEENCEIIDKRWEQIRKEGRELIDVVIPKCGKKVHQWQQQAQKSGEAKAHRIADVTGLYLRRQKISQWSSAAEIDQADKRLADAKEASAVAFELALEDQRGLAVAESALATATNHLQKLKTEMHRLEAELRGTPYHDPETGLSRSPLSHREKW
jgi:hypothetical protein